jgi:hypothetical protein
MKSLASVLIFVGAFMFGWCANDYNTKQNNIAWAPTELTSTATENVKYNISVEDPNYKGETIYLGEKGGK